MEPAAERVAVPEAAVAEQEAAPQADVVSPEVVVAQEWESVAVSV